MRVVGEGDLFGRVLVHDVGAVGLHRDGEDCGASPPSLSKARISDLLRKHPGLDHHLVPDVASQRSHDRPRDHDRAVRLQGHVRHDAFANVSRSSASAASRACWASVRTNFRRHLPGQRRGGPRVDRRAQGEEAFYALSGWTKAKFAFNSMRREEQRTLANPRSPADGSDATPRGKEPSAPPSENAGLESL